ncbi:MAG: PTS sugar transporter subunit IIA [Phycisphaerae bacterium]|nr:PTS sugar transporter subunit IIA [Phycisphaerae bacterium]
MIEIGKYIRPELIIPELKCKTKQDAIEQLVTRMFYAHNPIAFGGLNLQQVLDEVIKRENIHTTGLGNGLAYPHARIEQCSDLVLAIGICKDGVDFNSLDGQLCNIICLMISPARQPYIILQTMAAMSRFFINPDNAEKLKTESSPQRIAEMLRTSAPATGKTVLARDIMQPVNKLVRLDTSIEETTRIMHLNHLDVLPVVDSENRFCGEISCLKIFTYGIPDFFSQLQTVSFVKNLDPFEKYFKFRKDLKVGDLYEPGSSPVHKDTTLVEVIFQMTTKNKPELYVLDDNKLIGTIDRFSIIDRVLFF